MGDPGSPLVPAGNGAARCPCGRGPVQLDRGWLVCDECALEALEKFRARESYNRAKHLSRFDPVYGAAATAVADLVRGTARNAWQNYPVPTGRAERLRAWASRWAKWLGALWHRLASQPGQGIRRGRQNTGPRPPKPDYRPPPQRPPTPGAGSAIRPPPRDHTDLRDAARSLLTALGQGEPGLSAGYLPDSPAADRIPADESDLPIVPIASTILEP